MPATERADPPQSRARWRRPLAIIALGLVATSAGLVALEKIPGVPAGFRPLTRYQHWRAERFLAEAARATDAGDTVHARLALRSALDLDPGLTAAHMQLARLLLEEGRIPEGLAEAAGTGMDPARFGHDMLLFDGRFDPLLVFCVYQLQHDTARAGIWLQSALTTAPLASRDTRGRLLRLLPAANDDFKLVLLGAALLAADGRPAEAAARLESPDPADGPSPAEVLLGVDLLMRTADPARAWIWLNRQRSRLSPFDARCGDLRINLVRDPAFARQLLGSFAALPMNEARWARLASVLVIAGDATAADAFCRQLAARESAPTPGLTVTAWTLLMLHGNETDAADWEARYRRTGADGLPLLVGRKLSATDLAARSQAVRLLSQQAPLPREIIYALLMR